MQSNSFKNSAEFINLAPRVTALMRDLGFCDTQSDGEGRALMLSIPYAWVHVAMVDQMALDEPGNTGVGLMYVHSFKAQDFMVKAYENDSVGFGKDRDDDGSQHPVSVIMLDHNWDQDTLASKLTEFVETIHSRDRRVSQTYIINGQNNIEGAHSAPSADDLMEQLVGELANRILSGKGLSGNRKTH